MAPITRSLLIRIMFALQSCLTTIVKLPGRGCNDKREESARASVFLSRTARLDQPGAQRADVVTVLVLGAHQEGVVLLCHELVIEHAYQPALRELPARQLRWQQRHAYLLFGGACRRRHG